jgi:hypothetical protein
MNCEEYYILFLYYIYQSILYLFMKELGLEKMAINILYFLSLILFLYLVVDFYRRGTIIHEYMKVNMKENFTNPPHSVIETLLPKESNGSIMKRQAASMETLASMELKDVVVQSSFNSAYDGKNLSLDYLQKNLSQGYRLLDFEIYADKNKNPVVGYNPDKSTYYFKKNDTLILKDVFTAITKYGFNAPSPNPYQPLFVNIRIYIADTSEYVIYRKIAYYIENYFTSYMLLDENNVAIPITKNTTMDQLKQKLVLIIDTSILPGSYSKDEKLESYEELVDKCESEMAKTTDIKSYYKMAADHCQLRRWTNIRGGKPDMSYYSIQDLLRFSIQPVLINAKSWSAIRTIFHI